MVTLDVIIDACHYREMIRSFKDRRTAALYDDTLLKGVAADLRKRVKSKLNYLNAAQNLESLRSPPGNRLEALAGNRAGQHSIRVNEQWRICFVWRDGDAYDVEFVDYH